MQIGATRRLWKNQKFSLIVLANVRTVSCENAMHNYEAKETAISKQLNLLRLFLSGIHMLQLQAFKCLDMFVNFKKPSSTKILNYWNISIY